MVSNSASRSGALEYATDSLSQLKVNFIGVQSWSDGVLALGPSLHSLALAETASEISNRFGKIAEYHRCRT